MCKWKVPFKYTWTDTFISNGKPRRSQEKCCMRNEYVILCPQMPGLKKWSGRIISIIISKPTWFYLWGLVYCPNLPNTGFPDNWYYTVSMEMRSCLVKLLPCGDYMSSQHGAVCLPAVWDRSQTWSSWPLASPLASLRLPILSDLRWKDDHIQAQL